MLRILPCPRWSNMNTKWILTLTHKSHNIDNILKIVIDRRMENLRKILSQNSSGGRGGSPDVQCEKFTSPSIVSSVRRAKESQDDNVLFGSSDEGTKKVILKFKKN